MQFDPLGHTQTIRQIFGLMCRIMLEPILDPCGFYQWSALLSVTVNYAAVGS
ncbi:MAG: hypothetical protein DID90_2727553512 [Candidatus Nitrotoga sp. LAW]|nr:MAG: hypothetical protein DID90_2727553512 [Candidatus Nitrotoga sp. LAW]